MSPFRREIADNVAEGNKLPCILMCGHIYRTLIAKPPTRASAVVGFGISVLLNMTTELNITR